MKKSFHIKSQQVLKNCLEFIGKLELDRYEVVIQRMRKTSPQERYWHMCMDEIAEVTGTDTDDIKFGIKKAVLGLREWIDTDGSILMREISSTGLDKATYGRLIDATIALAKSMDVILPDPSFYGYEGIYSEKPNPRSAV